MLFVRPDRNLFERLTLIVTWAGIVRDFVSARVACVLRCQQRRFKYSLLRLYNCHEYVRAVAERCNGSIDCVALLRLAMLQDASAYN